MLMPVTRAGNRAFNRDPPGNSVRAAAAVPRHGDTLNAGRLSGRAGASACELPAYLFGGPK